MPVDDIDTVLIPIKTPEPELLVLAACGLYRPSLRSAKIALHRGPSASESLQVASLTNKAMVYGVVNELTEVAPFRGFRVL